MSGAPAWLYLHGFASSPASTKARAFEAWGKARDVAIDALDLRVPSFENLRFSAMKARVRAAIDASAAPGPTSSARAVLAMAPAFRLADRWKSQMTTEAWEAWRRDGFLAVDDHATKQKARVDFGFVEELERLDVGFPDVRVPVLIVHGRADEVVDIDRSRAFARRKRHVRLVEVDDGHELGASIPRILAEAEAFLRPFLGPFESDRNTTP